MSKFVALKTSLFKILENLLQTVYKSWQVRELSISELKTFFKKLLPARAGGKNSTWRLGHVYSHMLRVKNSREVNGEDRRRKGVQRESSSLQGQKGKPIQHHQSN